MSVDFAAWLQGELNELSSNCDDRRKAPCMRMGLLYKRLLAQAEI